MTEGQQRTEARRQIEFDGKLLPWNDARRVWEKAYLTEILTITYGNVRQAARFCEKDGKDFYTVMERNGIDPKDFRQDGVIPNSITRIEDLSARLCAVLRIEKLLDPEEYAAIGEHMRQARAVGQVDELKRQSDQRTRVAAGRE